MNYNYQRIIKEVKRLVKAANDAPTNKYSPSVWKYHLEIVAFYALKLAKKLKADLEIVELAAYLHDYAALLKRENAKKHHILGAQAAEKILSALGYPDDKTKSVAQCILCHRGSVKMKKPTIEAKIVASADAMSHFRCIPDMFYLAYNRHSLGSEEGAAWLKAKLLRSYDKMIPAGRKLIKKDKELFFKILNQVLE